jgi:DNA invertase Pin-like site-specific DNA recombinase
MAQSKLFGYARVSSKDQNPDRQIAAFKGVGIDERDIFLDRESGKDFNRDSYQTMIRILRDGDVVFVTSIDRLGRDYNEISKQWATITQEIKADIVVMDMPLLDTRNKDKDLTGQLIGDIVLKLLSYVAEVERRDIKERQRQGIEEAKKRGVYTGRKPIEIDKQAFENVYGEVVRKERTNVYAMQKLGLKPNTYYKAVERFKNRTGEWAE